MVATVGQSTTDVKRLTAALAAPFDRHEVKFKPQSVKGNRALAMAYVDARVVQDRLDEALGVENWHDEYQTLDDGSVICKLTCKLGDQWITKMDVGGPSEQPDGGDRLKAAVSDALKRAAVKFGIGRYLYRIPAQWVDYDPVKRHFTAAPRLAGEPTENRKVAGKNSSPSSALPMTGEELHERLREYDRKLSDRRLCSAGALLDHVRRSGEQHGYGADIATWNREAISFAVTAVKAFEASIHGPKSLASPSAAA